MAKKLITFTVKYRGQARETRVNLASVKKAMDFDSMCHDERDVYNECMDRAVEKMYGKGKYFMQDNSGYDGRGQIWEASKYGGSNSVTGIVLLDSDFYE